MLKLFTLIVVILLASFTTNAQAQNMLGATLTEVKQYYSENKGSFKDWKENTNRYKEFYASYTHKDCSCTIMCFIDNDIVVKYVIVDAERKKPLYIKEFDKEFIRVGENTWIDSFGECTWQMILEDGMVILEAHLNEKD